MNGLQKNIMTTPKRSENNIRICHIASGDLWAGAEIQVLNMIYGLTKIDSFNIIGIIMNKGKLYDELLKLGIDVYLVDEMKYSLIKQIIIISSIIAKHKIEIIHSHRYKENIIASLVKIILRNKTKLIKTQHGTFYTINKVSNKRMGIYRLIDMFCTKYIFNKVVAVSNEISTQFKRFIPENKISTIHNSISFEKYNVSPDKNTDGHSKQQPLNIAIIGRLVKIKNIDEFITIIADLESNGLKIQSYIVGDGPEKGHLKNLSAKRGSTMQNNFLGQIENISEIYNLLDILFITSVHEGLPTVILEAMYFGKIVIARDVGGIPEIIKHNVNGFLYNDVKEAKNFVRMIYKNRSKYDYIRVKANKIIKEKFGNMAQSQKYSEVYQSLLG